MIADDAIPDPMTPRECDLRDFPFMPLMVARLRRSKAWLLAKRQPELGFYMINLWAASWHDVPAASLEDDDDVLCDLAMCDPKRWPIVRDKVLRGWVKAADGRLYHPVVAEQANTSWLSKLARIERTEAARLAKMNRRAAEKAAAQNSVTESVTEPVTDSVAEPTDVATVSVGPPDKRSHRSATGSKGQGQGQGQGYSKKEAPCSPPIFDVPGVEWVEEDGRRRPATNGLYVDGAWDLIVEAGHLDLSRPWDLRPVVAWLEENIYPEQIAAAVRRVASRPRYKPPGNLQFFDGAVREQPRGAP